MQKKLGRLNVQRETLRALEPSDLSQAVRGASDESQCYSHCISDTFPGNCRTRGRQD